MAPCLSPRMLASGRHLTREKKVVRIADLTFEKHVYGRVRKHNLNPIKDFDPRPPEF